MTQYLTFQVYTAGPEFTTVPGEHILSELPPVGFLEGEVERLIDLIEETGDAARRLGVMIGPISLDHDEQQVRDLIERGFDLAIKHDIAVGFHIDDSKFWTRRAPMIGTPENVEWLDWNGPPNSGQFLHWGGEPWKLAPQLCFNAPEVVSEAWRMGGVIKAAVMENMPRLDDPCQFAGLIAGWETKIGKDFDTQQQLGKKAMANLGFGENNIPPDPVGLLRFIVWCWMQQWMFALSGVPRVYSHIVLQSGHTPADVAFGVENLPGYTAYADGSEYQQIRAALPSFGNPPWAVAEGANVNITQVPFQQGAGGMEKYLAGAFNYGANLVNLFGFGLGQPTDLFRAAAENPEAVKAYQRFLRGKDLREE